MIANHSNGKPWNVVIWARVSSREQREGYSIDAQLRADREKPGERGGTSFGNSNSMNPQALEDTCGVRLCFVENEFGPGAAGTFSFNVMAAVAQYYSDNLREEVLKGLDERVRQGWPTGLACYDYRNVKGDRDKPVQPHPVKSRTVIRIFELYATGRHTFESLADQLAQEGHIYRKSQPRFHRTALSYILNNRFYIGEIKRRGKYYRGKHQPLIDRATFQTCQDILNGKNRRYGNPDHPKVRWKADDLEKAIINDLTQLKMPSSEVADLFRSALETAFADVDAHQRRQAVSLAKRQSELKTMQDRLLNAYLAGTVGEKAFREKSAQLVAEEEVVRESKEQLGDFDPEQRNVALAVFDFSQNAAEIWRGSNNAVRREILDSVCLNRIL